MSSAGLTWFYLFGGLVYLITQSLIVMPLRVALSQRSRFLRALLYCPACTGAWVNLGLALAGFWPLSSMFPWWALPFGALIAGSACGLLWGGAQNALLGDHASAWAIEKGIYDAAETAEEAAAQRRAVYVLIAQLAAEADIMGDVARADAIRDVLDGLWKELTAEDREIMRKSAEAKDAEEASPSAGGS